jgi:nicotinate-nucleotide adenylyltransferase
MTRRERIGVLGGTFDPIHIGHLAVTQDAAYRLSLDRVLFVPNRIPPHKQRQHVSDVHHRLAMVELGVADNRQFAVSQLELERPGPSYTLDTMRELKARHGTRADLFFLVGCDALTQLHTWHQPQQLLDEFKLAIMNRPLETSIDWSELEARFPGIGEQVTVVDVPHLLVSGIGIRERVQRGEPIEYYVVPPVRRYIAEHGLYMRRSES